MAFLFVGFVSSWFSGSFSLEGCQLSVPGHPWGRLMSSCLPDHYTTCSPLQCCPLAALPLEMLGWPLLWNHHEIVCKNAADCSSSLLPPAMCAGARKRFLQSGGCCSVKGKKKKKKKPHKTVSSHLPALNSDSFYLIYWCLQCVISYTLQQYPRQFNVELLKKTDFCDLLKSSSRAGSHAVE